MDIKTLGRSGLVDDFGVTVIGGDRRLGMIRDRNLQVRERLWHNLIMLLELDQGLALGELDDTGRMKLRPNLLTFQGDILDWQGVW